MNNVLLLVILALFSFATAANPVRHYVFFGRDREKIKDSKSFFETTAFEGAQVAYSWRQLEPQKDNYDFSSIQEDLGFLRSKGKKLFVQIQDVTFSPARIPVPQYLVTDKQYNGGAAPQYSDGKGPQKHAGWMARRWDPGVRERFHKLLNALGKEFDGKIEGINLAETAAGMGNAPEMWPAGFTREAYREGIIENIRALRKAFSKSVVLVYANFMPGDWLPYEDNGYLRSVYRAALELKVGVGGPDVFPYKPGQMNNSYHLIRDSSGKVPIGMAVQDGNYEHIDPRNNKRVTARDIHDFAVGYLKVTYLFWGTEEPFYSEQTVPFLREKK